MTAKHVRGPLHTLGVWAVAGTLTATHGGALAGIDAWTPASVVGGVVQAIAIDPATPSVVYAGTAGSGVFKSSDGGTTWQAARTGIETQDVQALAIDPLNTSTIYAGTATEGMFRSSNGGASWSAVNEGLKNLNVYSITVHPQDPARVYAGTFGNLFESVNAAAQDPAVVTWTPIGVPQSTQLPNLINNDIYSVALDPANPETVFVGTHSGGVFRRLNASWQQVWADPRANPRTTISNVRALAVSNSGTTVFAATQGLGVYTSATSGDRGTWSAATGTGLTTSVLRTLAMPATDPTRLYAGTADGLFSSGDSGASWTAATTALNTLAIAIDPTTPDTVYAGTAQGLFKSTDGSAPGGATFTAAQTGITNFTVVGIANHSNDPDLRYAATTRSGVLRSTDGGLTWATFNEGLTDLNATAITLDPNSAGQETVFVGTSTGGIFRFPATDGTAVWAKVSEGLATRNIVTLAADPVRSGTVYAGTNAGVLITANGGLTWSSSNDGLADERSNGCTSNPTPACFYTNLVVDALAVDPTQPNVVYVGMSTRGVYKSADAGATWTTTSNGLTNAFVSAIAVDPTDGNRVYLGTHGGVFRSSDGGATWEEASSGLEDGEVTAIVVDPNTPATLYAGMAAAGVFKSTDRGDSWTAINTDLSNTAVQSLSLDSATNPPTLFAGVEADGLLSIQSTVSSGAPGPASSAATGSDGSASNGGGAVTWWFLFALLGSLAGKQRSGSRTSRC